MQCWISFQEIESSRSLSPPPWTSILLRVDELLTYTVPKMAFVFGAAVTNNNRQRKRRSVSSIDSLPGGGPAPEASVVVALHDEEARLLEQLAATRHKLKAAAAQKNHRSTLTTSSKHPRKYSASSSSSSSPSRHHVGTNNGPPERLSLPSVSTRVVPILSSTGEPVFEVGLNGSSTAEHVLPVFRLPQVDESTANFLNRIPTELTEVQAERELENRQDDEALAESLGLSMEELIEFQMEAAERTGNKQQLRRAWESQKSLLGGGGGSQLLEGPESSLRPQGLPELRLGGGATTTKDMEEAAAAAAAAALR